MVRVLVFAVRFSPSPVLASIRRFKGILVRSFLFDSCDDMS